MKKEITFCYRKIIGHDATKAWDRLIFDDSYMEYRMQVQNFEQHKEYPAYGELIYYVPQAKELTARVAPAITGYIQQLNGTVPDVLNNLGRRFMKFEDFTFELINSHFEQKEKHQVGINFFSEPYIWEGDTGNYMIITPKNQNNGDGPRFAETLMLPPYLSIYTIKDYEH